MSHETTTKIVDGNKWLLTPSSEQSAAITADRLRPMQGMTNDKPPARSSLASAQRKQRRGRGDGGERGTRYEAGTRRAEKLEEERSSRAQLSAVLLPAAYLLLGV